MRRAIPRFVLSCVIGITVNAGVGHRNASSSLALSTALAEIFGYPAASRVAKHASSSGISISRAAVECGLLDEESADRMFEDVSAFANAEKQKTLFIASGTPALSDLNQETTQRA
ncbi:MAG: hypothetical protein QHC91_15215 [Shinella sp.]|nr:hypothetical protein [Shinella sp.]